MTLQFASISEIFGGSVLVEQVFSYPGLGQAAVSAGLGSDMPLLMAITMISALFVFGGNLIAIFFMESLIREFAKGVWEDEKYNCILKRKTAGDRKSDRKRNQT